MSWEPGLSGLPDEIHADIMSGIVPRSQLEWCKAMITAGCDSHLMFAPGLGWHAWAGRRWRCESSDGAQHRAVPDRRVLFNAHVAD